MRTPVLFVVSSALAASALGASLVAAGPAAAAVPATAIDVTVPQTCQYGPDYAPGGVRTTLHVPARVQFSVPTTLRRGDTLELKDRKVTLLLGSEVHAAFQASVASTNDQVSLSANPVSLVPSGVEWTGTRTWAAGPSWPLSSAGPATAEMVPAAITPYDVNADSVAVRYSGIHVSVAFQHSDFFLPFKLTCTADEPTTLITLPVAPERGTPSVQALSDVQSPLGGGAEVRIQGHNFTGVDAVSFGGVEATSFTVVADDVIRATVPPHAAADGVQVRVSRGNDASDDTPLDDFDYAGPAGPGRFDVSIPQRCVDPAWGVYTESGFRETRPEVRFDATLRLRGVVPESVSPGAGVPVTGLKASVLIGGAATSALSRGDDAQKRYWTGQVYNLKAAASAASLTEVPLGGALMSLPQQIRPGEPVALRAADLSWQSPAVPVTAAGPEGSSVVLSAPSFNLTVGAEFGGGLSIQGPQATCATAPGASSVLARVPIGAPVSTVPVVTRVQGLVFPGFGGLVAVTGRALTGAPVVTIGGKRTKRLGVFGGTVYVLAPALRAGTYDVVVTTAGGTSVVAAATKVRY